MFEIILMKEYKSLLDVGIYEQETRFVCLYEFNIII